MRSLILVMALLCLFAKANATVLTVSNHPQTAGQYTTLPAAYAAANVGDTLYLHGSPNNYGNLTINKRLVLIGAGYNDSTSFGMSTSVGIIYIDTATSGPFAGMPISGTKLLGLECSYVQTFNGVNNIVISRCRMLNPIYIKGDNWIIENNITDVIYFSGTVVSSCIVRNNIIYYRIAGLGVISAPGLLIDHNIIWGTNTIPIDNINFAVISNNIFFGENPGTSDVQNCSFNNNMAIGPTPGTFPGGTNTGSGNVITTFTPSQFGHSLTTGSLTFAQIVNSDWHLKTTSLGHNTATDGTDMGIYGGLAPMPNMTGAPGTIPQMTFMNIFNTSVSVGTPINVRVKARRVN